MSTATGSFNRSTLGAFKRSTLGVRDAVAALPQINLRSFVPPSFNRFRSHYRRSDKPFGTQISEAIIDPGAGLVSIGITQSNLDYFRDRSIRRPGNGTTFTSLANPSASTPVSINYSFIPSFLASEAFTLRVYAVDTLTNTPTGSMSLTPFSNFAVLLGSATSASLVNSARNNIALDVTAYTTNIVGNTSTWGLLLVTADDVDGIDPTVQNFRRYGMTLNSDDLLKREYVEFAY